MKEFFQNRSLKSYMENRYKPLPKNHTISYEELEKVILGDYPYKEVIMILAGHKPEGIPSYRELKEEHISNKLKEVSWFAQFRPESHGKVSYVISPKEMEYMILWNTNSKGFKDMKEGFQPVPPRESGFVIFDVNPLKDLDQIYAGDFCGREGDKIDTRVFYCEEIYSKVKEMLQKGLE